MKDPREDIAQFGAGLPGFEIVFDRPTPLGAWLRGTTAIMGTLARCAR